MLNQLPLPEHQPETATAQESLLTSVPALDSLRTPNTLSGTSTVGNATAVAYAEGQTIVHMMGLGKRAYVVTSGEVAIYVNGRPVDLIEAGEYFDESIWLGGEALALTDCVLRTVNTEPQALLPH